MKETDIMIRVNTTTVSYWFTNLQNGKNVYGRIYFRIVNTKTVGLLLNINMAKMCME